MRVLLQFILEQAEEGSIRCARRCGIHPFPNRGSFTTDFRFFSKLFFLFFLSFSLSFGLPKDPLREISFSFSRKASFAVTRKSITRIRKSGKRCEALRKEISQVFSLVAYIADTEKFNPANLERFVCRSSRITGFWIMGFSFFAS